MTIAPFVYALPRKRLSRLVGELVRIPLPRPLLVPAIHAWCRAYGADLAEADRPAGAYRTFLEFFTRGLKPGARPQHPDPRAVTSPADGRVHVAAPVEAGTTLQAKGAPYRLAELLGSEEDAAAFEGGTSLVAYLAPGDYHRFHWPLDGAVEEVRHLPGDLWPVHPGAAASVPRLLARNERVACLGRTPDGRRFALVAVGALNVGSIRLAFHRLRTNRGTADRRAWRTTAHGRRGDLFGWFEMGSALVLLLAKDAGRLDDLAPGTRLLVGARVGALARSGG